MTPFEAQARNRRKLLAAARAVPPLSARSGARLPSAFFLTDPRRTADPETVAARLPAGWGVIYRHFGAAGRFETATRLAAIARARKLVLLIAADPDLARRVGADGVHWPERLLRRRGRGQGVITASAHSRAAIVRARQMGADAVFVSTVFESDSSSAKDPMGPWRFSALAEASPLPCYALGGVSAKNAKRIASFAGLASIQGISDSFGR